MGIFTIPNIIVANIFSFIGASLLAISTFYKKRDKMLYIQAGDCLANALACLFSGSFSGATTNGVSIIRNLVSAKTKHTRVVAGVFCAIILTMGLIFNTKGIIGLLPVVASMEYTLCMGFMKNTQGLRIALLINVTMWFAHDLYMLLIPAVISEVMVFIVCVINIVRYRKAPSGDAGGEEPVSE